MNRIKLMQRYWNRAALDPDVDEKYICDLPTEDCKLELGEIDGDVLEIGCGVGRLMEDGWYGVDISEKMIRIAEQRKPKCFFEIIKNELPYLNDSFDHVYSMLLFQHLKPNEIKNYLKESYRVLKPGGTLKFQFVLGKEREPFSNHYLITEISQFMYEAGFRKINFKPSKIHPLWLWAESVK